MQRIFWEYIDRLAAANDAASLQEALNVIAEYIELPRFAYLAMPRSRKDTTKLISTYPVYWTDHYLSSKYERFDPVIVRADLDSDPFDWRKDSARKGDDEQAWRFFNEAAAFGICSGITFPIHDGCCPTAAVTFATDRRSPTSYREVYENIRLLHFMIVLFHFHARRKLGPPWLVHGARLSPREYECLCLAADGKSAWHMAQLLDISQAMAASHIASAKGKLGVRTICQAVFHLGSLR